MLSKLLYMVIGIAIGIIVPHLQTIGNATLSKNWELLMSELSVTWQPIVVLVPIMIVIALVLRRADRKNESRRADAETHRWQQIEDRLDVVVTQAVKKAVEEALNDKPNQKGDDKEPKKMKG